MMMETTMSRSLRLMFSGSVALGIGMLAQPVLAQTTDTTAAQPVQRVEITGSNIRRVDAETPSPVQIITADDMKKSGYTSVAEVLQNITANGQGTLTGAQSNSFASGASAIALRGLNTGATLTLIDGHRMAPYPLADNAQYAIVDINNIPFDSVERVEVLKDGASAVYGSDAIAGVVNIILKKTYTGTTVNADGGGTKEGGGANFHASIIHGIGDLNEDGYNSYVTLEVKHQNEVNWESRAGEGPWAAKNFSSTGGLNLAPGYPNPFNYNSPVSSGTYLAGNNTGTLYFPAGSGCSQAGVTNGCPWYPHSQILPETENINLLGSFTKRLGDGWELNVKASLFNAKTDFDGEKPSFTYGNAAYVPGYYGAGAQLSASHPTATINPNIPYYTISLPANYAYYPVGEPTTILGTLAAAPRGENKVDSKAVRLVADLTGTIGEWDIKGSVGYTRTNSAQTTYGTVNNFALNNAINRATNPFNIFSTHNSAADNAAIFPEQYSNSLSLLEFGEVHASRSLMALPGGDMGFSTGLAYDHREVNQVAPPLAAQGVVGGNLAYALGEQNDASAYAELVLPVLKSLEVDFAERFDHIDTTGNAITGKGSFKWTATDSFALRGAASTGFRAPNINEGGNAGTLELSTPTNDPHLCKGGVGVADNVTSFCGWSPLTLGVASPTVKPERSTSFTLGTVIEPIKGWSSTIDLYKITISDQIIIPTPDYNTAVPIYSSVAVPGSIFGPKGCSTGGTGLGPCTNPAGYNLPVWYTAQFQNANSTVAQGVEVGTRYKFRLGDFGTLKTEFDWTHVMSYAVTENGIRYQLNDTHGPSAVSNDTGNPQDRVDVTLGWDKGPLNITTNFDYIGRYSILDPSAGQTTCASAAQSWYLGATPPTNYCHVASFLNTNVTARYQITKQWSVNGAIGNLFNRQPPVDLETYGNNGVATNMTLYTAGAMGRSFHVGTSYTF